MTRPIVVIDPGHGGWDPGRIAVDDVKESTSNWRLAEALGRALSRRYDVEVVFTHIGDDTCLDESGNLARELAGRSWVANRIKADLLVSLHHDGHNDDTVRGGSMWVWTSKNAPTGGLVWLPASGNHTDPKSIEIAKTLTRHVRPALASFGIPWRTYSDPDGVACSNFGILRNTQGAAVLLEAYYGTNAEDVAIARRPEFVPSLADAIADGIAEALGLAKIVERPFVDIPTDHPFVNELTEMRRAGVLNGQSDGRLNLSLESIRVLVIAWRMFKSMNK